ncbi:MAG TPA: NADP-dependent succinic semialdehyde dehydrogenase [Acidimicrobiales bacterium]|nr:NADP-dependent succinic semialdehyde dehydrogenase [Acidimicrobiales bacterium]
MPIATVNPATGKTEKTFDPHTDAEVEATLARAAHAARSYRTTTFAERARWTVTAAELLEGEIPVIARLMTTEMGKTFASAKGEAAKCAKGLRFFAEHAEGFLADERVESDARDSRVLYRPMGPVLAVMPWNFPLWQVMRFAAPALMAGNIGLLKHASNVPQTALFIEELFHRAGFPPGVFQTLLIPAGQVAGIIEDPRVRAVTLTGSEEAGRSVAATAGRAIKKSVLELGGSDPFVVLPSADLDDAVRVGVTARVQNNGQSCIAAKRFIVHRDCYDAFEEAYVTSMAGLSVGDPMEPATEIGPLALASGRDDVAGLVDDARDKGAHILCGGAPIDGPGYFYPPTVITGITPAMRVNSEEVFGPVALLYRVDSADEALRQANDTGFGLGASVWTDDPDERRLFVEGLDAGMVFLNAMVASTPELPFGGTKRSGYGRELAALGIREFCEAKSVWQA